MTEEKFPKPSWWNDRYKRWKFFQFLGGIKRHPFLPDTDMDFPQEVYDAYRRYVQAEEDLIKVLRRVQPALSESTIRKQDAKERKYAKKHEGYIPF